MERRHDRGAGRLLGGLACALNVLLLALCAVEAWAPEVVRTELCGCASGPRAGFAFLGIELSLGKLGLAFYALMLLTRRAAPTVRVDWAIAAACLHAGLYGSLVRAGGTCQLCLWALALAGLLLLVELPHAWLTRRPLRAPRLLAVGGAALLAVLGGARLLPPESTSAAETNVLAAREPSLAPPAEGLVLETFLQHGCGYCSEQLRQLEYVESRGLDLAVHSVTVDPAARSAASERARALGIRRYPTTVLWRHGTVAMRWEGVAYYDDLLAALGP